MENELDKVDILRSRFRIGYEDARKALSESSGDVVAALSALEKSRSGRKDLLGLGAEIADEFRKVISGGPIKKLRVKYGGRVLHESPVALTAAVAALVGLAALLITKLVIEVEKDDERAET